ncbi:transcriptional regulator, partial [Micromonospora craterilacus]
MRPAALDWSVDNCTVARAMEILGEKWTLVVLREVFSGVRRFDDMRVRTGVPRQVLTNRLATLVDQGVLRREPYREPGTRLRHEYRLTAKGLDLWPVLVAVLAWGDRYLADPEGPPLSVGHRDCGADVHIELHCAAGHHLTEP